MEEWKNGRVERFYHGGKEITELEERMSGMMEEWVQNPFSFRGDNGEWKNGRVEEWKDFNTEARRT
jgi:hypothetical protein